VHVTYAIDFEHLQWISERTPRLRSVIHCEYSISIVRVTYAIDFEHSQWMSERTPSWVGLSSVKRGLSSGSRDLVWLSLTSFVVMPIALRCSSSYSLAACSLACFSWSCSCHRLTVSLMRTCPRLRWTTRCTSMLAKRTVTSNM